MSIHLDPNRATKSQQHPGCLHCPCILFQEWHLPGLSGGASARPLLLQIPNPLVPGTPVPCSVHFCQPTLHPRDVWLPLLPLHCWWLQKAEWQALLGASEGPRALCTTLMQSQESSGTPILLFYARATLRVSCWRFSDARF